MSTRHKDERDKPVTYAQMGVTEYFQYDPSGDYLQPRLRGRRLVNGEYLRSPDESERDRLQERERATQAELALEEERQRAEQAEAQLQKLRQRILEQGIDPSTLE